MPPDPNIIDWLLTLGVENPCYTAWFKFTRNSISDAVSDSHLLHAYNQLATALKSLSASLLAMRHLTRVSRFPSKFITFLLETRSITRSSYWYWSSLPGTE